MRYSKAQLVHALKVLVERYGPVDPMETGADLIGLSCSAITKTLMHFHPELHYDPNTVVDEDLWKNYREFSWQDARPVWWNSPNFWLYHKARVDNLKAYLTYVESWDDQANAS